MANFASWNASPSMGNAIYNKVYNNKVKMNGKIIIACDSYKGCLTSREVNEAIASGIKGPLEKVCGYRSTIKILFCPFIKLNNG